MWLGVLVAVLPLLGFPATWKSVVYFISGALIAVNSYQLSKHKIMRSRRAERKHRENITSPTPESFSVPQMPDIIPPSRPIDEDETHNNPPVGT